MTDLRVVECDHWFELFQLNLTRMACVEQEQNLTMCTVHTQFIGVQNFVCVDVGEHFCEL